MLELVDLHRKYGKKAALDGLTLRVKRGELVGFLGPNGAGKTTAMRAALGIVRPDSGTLRWDGKALDLETRLRFGYMPEERGLYQAMKVIDQLVYLGRLHRMTASDARKAGEHWLNVLGVGDRKNERLDALSLGNQQRVQMAAALVHQPDVLILDEPFSGLDPVGIEALSTVLRERANEGAAVVFSSHQLDLVEGLCEQVVVVHKGRDVTSGTVEALTATTDRLRVEVHGDADATWTQQLGGVEVLSVAHGVAHLQLVGDTSSDAVLAAAQAAGSVQHFSFERRKLSEVFKMAVTA